MAVEKIDGNVEPGFVIYRVPVGTDKFCTHQLKAIAKQILEDAHHTAELPHSSRRKAVTLVCPTVLNHAQVRLLVADELTLRGGANCKLVGLSAVENP